MQWYLALVQRSLRSPGEVQVASGVIEGVARRFAAAEREKEIGQHRAIPQKVAHAGEVESPVSPRRKRDKAVRLERDGATEPLHLGEANASERCAKLP